MKIVVFFFTVMISHTILEEVLSFHNICLYKENLKICSIFDFPDSTLALDPYSFACLCAQLFHRGILYPLLQIPHQNNLFKCK